MYTTGGESHSMDQKLAISLLLLVCPECLDRAIEILDDRKPTFVAKSNLLRLISSIPGLLRECSMTMIVYPKPFTASLRRPFEISKDFTAGKRSRENISGSSELWGCRRPAWRQATNVEEQQAARSHWYKSKVIPAHRRGWKTRPIERVH